MNTLITILILLFAIFGFTVVGFAYKPIIKRKIQESSIKHDTQHDKFLKYLSPEIIDKLKSLNADNYFY